MPVDREGITHPKGRATPPAWPCLAGVAERWGYLTGHLHGIDQGTRACVPWLSDRYRMAETLGSVAQAIEHGPIRASSYLFWLTLNEQTLHKLAALVNSDKQI